MNTAPCWLWITAGAESTSLVPSSSAYRWGTVVSGAWEAPPPKIRSLTIPHFLPSPLPSPSVCSVKSFLELVVWIYSVVWVFVCLFFFLLCEPDVLSLFQSLTWCDSSLLTFPRGLLPHLHTEPAQSFSLQFIATVDSTSVCVCFPHIFRWDVYETMKFGPDFQKVFSMHFWETWKYMDSLV